MRYYLVRETYDLYPLVVSGVLTIHEDHKKYANSNLFLVAEDVFWLLCSGREPKSSPRRLSGPWSVHPPSVSVEAIGAKVNHLCCPVDIIIFGIELGTTWTQLGRTN